VKLGISTFVTDESPPPAVEERGFDASILAGHPHIAARCETRTRPATSCRNRISARPARSSRRPRP
jgi:hypothetical protein